MIKGAGEVLQVRSKPRLLRHKAKTVATVLSSHSQSVHFIMGQFKKLFTFDLNGYELSILLHIYHAIIFSSLALTKVSN